MPAFALIGGRRSLAGSMIGGIRETQEMLDFCAEHGIGAEIEMISADQINEAYDRVVDSDVRRGCGTARPVTTARSPGAPCPRA